MITINTIAVDESISGTFFACDLIKCRGACCTLAGGRGAPLKDSEINKIMTAMPIVARYLPAEHLQTIEKMGPVEGRPGSYATTCHNHRACSFVYFEGTTAKCAFERAFLDGESSWRKPLSCHLFPIRYDDGIFRRLRYEEIEECSSALAKGRKDKIHLFEFLQPALTTAFGKEWYSEFEKLCRERSQAMRTRE